MTVPERVIAHYDGGYGRRGEIRVLDGRCDVCHEVARVIAVDSSEGEYRHGHVCAACVVAATNPETGPTFERAGTRWRQEWQETPT